MRANGGKYFNEDYPGEVYYKPPTAIGALRFWQDLIYKDKVMPSGVFELEADQRRVLLRQARDGDAQHWRAGLYAREQQRF